MKKFSLFLSIVILFATFIPTNSYGAPEYNKKLEEAIIKSKSLFNITNEYDKFNSNVSSFDGKTFFYLNWIDSTGKLGEINVNISSDGTIYSYNKFKSDYENKKSTLPSISKDEGLNIAINAIKNINPQICEEIIYNESQKPINPNSSEYNYEFIRIQNGIPYFENYLYVSIDKNTGGLMSYYLNWDEKISFPNSKDIIDLDKAIELYKEKIGLNLVYKINYVDGIEKIYLVYTSLENNVGIDAKTGEVVSYNDYIGFAEEKDDMIFNDESLSPDESKAIRNISNLISSEEAEKSAREVLNIDDEYKMSSINLYSYIKKKNEYAWTISFQKGQGENSDYQYDVSLDAKTGDIISFYFSFPKEDIVKESKSKDQAMKIAEDYIKKMNPEIYNEVELYKDFEDRSDDNLIYYFNYIRKYNGAYIADDSISIYVDGKNGNIVGYNKNWHKGEIPQLVSKISIEEAYKKLFEDLGMEIKYVTANDITNSKKTDKTIKLCYCIKPDKPLNISAETGEFLDYNGKPFKEEKIARYRDIENSYAKEKILVLAEHGIDLPGENFKPKDKIKQREFLYLLAKSNSQTLNLEDENSDEKLYNYLIKVGIIKEEEKNPEKIITKEESIKYLIRMLKYDKVADINGIYKDLFKDSDEIDNNLKGYVSIAYGLNIISGSNGYLKPKSELSREDAANMIYNYLFNN
ncbi:MAG: S-layer-like y domain-containing protein [Sporanaerobacter sp.]|jgi:predicted small secreted protein|uniref:YcdB/YcdC domain-containing protein n=1 Tax=Sporanaerobacter sp. TaxID=2010183 RepID=UPI003A10023C